VRIRMPESLRWAKESPVKQALAGGLYPSRRGCLTPHGSVEQGENIITGVHSWTSTSALTARRYPALVLLLWAVQQ
jgi:hypothetical protein